MNRSSRLEQLSSGSIVVYTDGACSNNGQHDSVAGIGVFWADNHPDNVSDRLNGNPTNNRAELHAAICAIRIARMRNYTMLHIRTDSHYVMKGATDWIYNWRSNGWINLQGNPVANRADWMTLWNEMTALTVSWEYVPAHRSHYGNEMADELARMAL